MNGINLEKNFLVTARKFRPQTFDDVVGQNHITGTLKNAIKTGRIHHAYLFCGPRGVGKTTTARILARAVNCLNPENYEPCNQCENCLAILENRSMDVIEIDGASNNSVDDVRKLRENARYAPSSGKYKMYIIDEVHMLSNAAFNALLKILEEPPSHLLFVFATTEAHKVLPTITSRCQRYDFKRMEIQDIVNQLMFISDKENITIDDNSLRTIAKKGDGSMRDAESIFDQVIAFCGKNVSFNELKDALHIVDMDLFFEINECIKFNKHSELFRIADSIQNDGFDYGEILSGMIEFYRNLAALKSTGNIKILDISPDYHTKFLNEIESFSLEDLIRIINHLLSSELSLKNANQPKIKFELALLQLATMAKTKNINDILNLLTKISENPSLNLNVEKPKELISESNVNYKSQKKTIQAPVQPTIQPDSSDIKKINIINDKTSESKVKANKELDADGDIEEILMTLFDAKEIVD